MARFSILLATAVVLTMTVGTALTVGSALAGGEGLMNAVSYKPMPGDKIIAIRPFDNSDNNMALKAQFEQALQARGYRISKDAALVFNFEVRTEVGAWATAERRSIIELEGRGSVNRDETAKARVNIFNSKRGGLLNAGEGGGTSITTPSQYRIDATIDDSRDGHRLWQAWATADLNQSDGPTVSQAMVPIMVGNLGATVKRLIFKLP